MKTIARALVVERHTYFRGLPKEERYFRLHIILNNSKYEIEDYFRVDPELRACLEIESKAIIKQIYIMSIDNRDSPLHNLDLYFETRGQIRIYREIFNRNYLNL